MPHIGLGRSVESQAALQQPSRSSAVETGAWFALTAALLRLLFTNEKEEIAGAGGPTCILQIVTPGATGQP